MDNSQTIAKRIKEKAGSKNIKLGKMFNDLELSKNTLHNMQVSMPAPETLAKIADYLGMTLDELVGMQKNSAPDQLRNAIIQRVLKLPDSKAEKLLGYLEGLTDAE